MTASAKARAQPAGPRLRRNAIWMFVGQGGYAAGQWAILIILAKLGGPVLVGQFSLALAITTPIFVFSQLQMRQIQVVDTTGRYPFADYRAVRLGTTAPALLTIAALAALGGYAAPVAAAILALGLTRAIEGLSDIYYGLAQRREQLDRVAQSMLLRTLIGCTALGLVLLLTDSLVAGLLAQAVAWAAVWWLFDRRIVLPRRGGEAAAAAGAMPRRGPDGSGALRRRLRLAWLGLPLGGTLLLGALNINVPRYAVEGFLGLEALGIFAALGHFVFAGTMVINAVCQAASPRLANLFAAGELGSFRRLLLQLIAAGALLGGAGLLAAFLVGEPLLHLLYGPAFGAHVDLLLWIMAVGVVHYVATPLGHGLSAMHRFRVQPVIQGSAVGVNTLACLILVPRYGLAGAAGAWFLAFACQMLISLALNAWYLRRAAVAAGAGRAAGLPAPGLDADGRSPL